MDLPLAISNVEIVQLIKQKKPEGFRLLYDKYARSLYGIIFRMVNDSVATENILSETFVLATKEIEDYRPERCGLFIWMLQISRSLSQAFIAQSRVEKNQEHSTIFDMVFNRGFSVQAVSDLLLKQKSDCALLFRKELKNLNPELL